VEERIPADNQETTDDDVSFTAGDAVCTDGRCVPTFLGVLCSEVSSSCYAIAAPPAR